MYSPDGETVAQASEDDQIYLNDATSADYAELSESPLDDIDGRFISVDFSPDGSLFAGSAFDDAGASVWSTSDWSLEESFGENMRGVAFSKTGDYLTYSDRWGDELYIRDTDDWSLVDTLTVSEGEIDGIDWTVNDDYLIVGDTDGKEVRIFDGDELGSDPEPVETLTFDWEIWPVSVSPDNQLVAFGGHNTPDSDGRLSIYEVGSWSHVETITSTDEELRNIDWSADSSLIGSVGKEDNQGYIHDTDSWSLQATPGNLSDFGYAIAFRENQQVAVAGNGGDMEVFDIVSNPFGQ